MVPLIIGIGILSALYPITINGGGAVSYPEIIPFQVLGLVTGIAKGC